MQVLEVPGHTRAHIACHLPARAPDQREELFYGDTLFVAGCGRLLEGTAEQMHDSLAEQRRTNLFVQARDGRELAALRESKNQWRG